MRRWGEGEMGRWGATCSVNHPTITRAIYGISCLPDVSCIRAELDRKGVHQ